MTRIDRITLVADRVELRETAAASLIALGLTDPDKSYALRLVHKVKRDTLEPRECATLIRALTNLPANWLDVLSRDVAETPV